MPNCLNCESFVSEAYVRVFTPENLDGPRVCPQCEDKIRDGGTVRTPRSARN